MRSSAPSALGPPVRLPRTRGRVQGAAGWTRSGSPGPRTAGPGGPRADAPRPSCSSTGRRRALARLAAAPDEAARARTAAIEQLLSFYGPAGRPRDRSTAAALEALRDARARAALLRAGRPPHPRTGCRECAFYVLAPPATRSSSASCSAKKGSEMYGLGADSGFYARAARSAGPPARESVRRDRRLHRGDVPVRDGPAMARRARAHGPGPGAGRRPLPVAGRALAGDRRPVAARPPSSSRSSWTTSSTT